ncbi:Cytochrome bo(3) ubiquinol oxidase subunit 3 [invertebrate metagenome]|uniref:Cytochrome bo(3) ubiquinol oxidase subunit 3 n=1 Tax=invertebrate metagenome TaxID=1711999 RepID=A0A2H9T8A9_9ZZZZ
MAVVSQVCVGQMLTAADDYGEQHDSSDTTLFGFWVYLMSDCILFASLFAVYAVLSNRFIPGITPHDLFDLYFVLSETFVLLLSSFTFGMAMLAFRLCHMKAVVTWLIITFLLGVIFLVMELYEFHHFMQAGVSYQSYGYWSAFYALVATHGFHVFAGLLWIIVLFVHFWRNGATADNKTRLSCLSLFWHFLDIIWICVFSVVYLTGVL